MKVMEYLSQKFKDLLYSEMRQYLPYCLHCSVDVVDTAVSLCKRCNEVNCACAIKW